MHPIICQIGPFTIYSYGLTLVVAFTVVYLLAAAQARIQHISTHIIFNLAFIVFLSGIIGARIFYIMENANYYINNIPEMVMLQRGGLSWYGGLMLGSICGILYLIKKNLSVYKILDLVIPFVALGQAIGRIGCLLNGCCFGKVSRFGIYFDAHKSVLIPTQVYSSLALILIFIALRLLQARPHKDGVVFFAYLLLYSIKRFFIEFWRADNELIFLGMTLFQIISIAIFLLSFLKLISIQKIKK